MLDYTGIKCPVCQVPFGKDDDIVVCPQCGAPYHRACYEKEGKCIFDDLHAQGKDWQPPAAPKVEPSAEIKDQECPVCGTLNGHSARFCSSCGASLQGGPQPNRDQAPPFYGAAQGQPYSGAMPFVLDPMGGVSPAEELAPGVTFGDASKLVKQSTGYYMPVFRYMKHTGKNKFSFCAFLFSGPWMLYRKQYKLGALFTVLVFGLFLGYQFLAAYVSIPALLAAVEALSLDPSTVLDYTSPEFSLVVQYLAQNPSLYLQTILPLGCLLLALVIMIIAGVKGNKWYMGHCIRTAQAVKGDKSLQDPNKALDQKGGVNVPIAVCMFVCYLLIVNLVPAFL